MKTLFTTLCLFIFIYNSNAQGTIQLSDFDVLNHTSWTGKLTYKDYQSGKPNTIDATTQIEIIKEKLIFNIQYTYEPHKNNKSSVRIKKNGTYYGNEKVISNTLENGTRTIITSYEGKDNGEKAIMFVTRQFSTTRYSVTKEVQLKNTDERFVRNTYEFTKIK